MKLPAIVCDAQNLSQVAIIQELGKYKIPIISIADTGHAIGNASKYISKKYNWSVPSYSEEYIHNIITYLERGVIFYSNDPNTENISEHKQKLLSSGFKVIVADRSILNTVINKENLYISTQECSVKVPKTAVVHTYEDLLFKSSEINYPFILKANNFAGGIYTLVTNKAEVQYCYKMMREKVDDKINLTWRQSSLLIQEWIPQDNLVLWNFSAIVLNGEIKSYSMGRRIRTNLRKDGTIGSTLMHGETEYNKMIFENNKRLFRHLTYEGFVETEWSIDKVTHEIYLYDFNPRPSGNIRWALNSGLDIYQFYSIAINNAKTDSSHEDIKSHEQVDCSNEINTSIKMIQNVKYYKIFYEVNDFTVAVSNPKLTYHQKFLVLAENIFAICQYKKNVIDILDSNDLKPTIIASKKVPYIYIKSLIKLILSMLLSYLPAKTAQIIKQTISKALIKPDYTN